MCYVRVWVIGKCSPETQAVAVAVGDKYYTNLIARSENVRVYGQNKGSTYGLYS